MGEELRSRLSSQAGRALGLLFGAVFAIACSDPKPSAAETTNARRADPPADAASAESSSSVAASPNALPPLRSETPKMAVQIRTPAAPSKADQATLEKQIKEALPDVPLGGVGVPSSKLELDAPGELPEIPAMYFEDLDAGVKKAVRARSGIFFAAALDHDKGLKRLKAFEALAFQMVKKRNGAIWDESMHAVITAAEWEAARVASWEGDLCDATRHMRIFEYPVVPGRFRAITYGMRIFGLPDLVIDDVPPTHSDQAGLLLRAAAQTLVEGAELTATGQLEIDLTGIKHTAAKKRLLGVATKPGRLVIKLKVAKKEEDDLESPLYAFDTSSFTGATPGEQLGSALETLFGPIEGELIFREDAEHALAELAKRVQAKLPELAARVKKGIQPGDALAVKGPFDTDDGSVEWMWIDVYAWDKGTVRGHLSNTPAQIKGLKAGAKVEVPEGKIADYLWKKADGTSEGGESIEILKGRRRGE